jgi:hypothetical protein
LAYNSNQGVEFDLFSCGIVFCLFVFRTDRHKKGCGYQFDGQRGIWRSPPFYQNRIVRTQRGRLRLSEWSLRKKLTGNRQISFVLITQLPGHLKWPEYVRQI